MLETILVRFLAEFILSSKFVFFSIILRVNVRSCLDSAIGTIFSSTDTVCTLQVLDLNDDYLPFL